METFKEICKSIFYYFFILYNNFSWPLLALVISIIYKKSFLQGLNKLSQRVSHFKMGDKELSFGENLIKNDNSNEVLLDIVNEKQPNKEPNKQSHSSDSENITESNKYKDFSKKLFPNPQSVHKETDMIASVNPRLSIINSWNIVEKKIFSMVPHLPNSLADNENLSVNDILDSMVNIRMIKKSFYEFLNNLHSLEEEVKAEHYQSLSYTEAVLYDEKCNEAMFYLSQIIPD
jgi:hypothetical protein